MIHAPNAEPNIFICSSTEGLAEAEQIQVGLDHHASNVSVWTDQVFGPMKHTMEDLEQELETADFAIAVVTGDDVVRSRKKQARVPRDNVIFELGLFMGQLGRERTIIVRPRGIDLKLPSDLLGLNPLSFSPPSDPRDARQLAVSLGPVCTQLKTLFDRLGPR
jgi:CRP/FNR family transcriptional regulator, cyclic AMP receptor protein